MISCYLCAGDEDTGQPSVMSARQVIHEAVHTLILDHGYSPNMVIVTMLEEVSNYEETQRKRLSEPMICVLDGAPLVTRDGVWMHSDRSRAWGHDPIPVTTERDGEPVVTVTEKVGSGPQQPAAKESSRSNGGGHDE